MTKDTGISITRTVLVLLVAGLFGAMLFAGSVAAQDTDAAREALNLVGGGDGAPVEDSVDAIIVDVVDILTLLIGAGAIIMFLFGSFRFITSAGDANKVQTAKNTIVWSIVGLLVAVFSNIIVGAVISLVDGDGA